MDDLGSFMLKVTSYLKNGIWQVRLGDQPRPKAAFIKLLRTAVLSVRGFAEDNCQLRASSLTFYSLLSIVPVAAMAFGIAKGFGFEKKLQEQLLEQIPGQEQVLLQVVESAHRFLDNTKGGLIAGIGVVVLFWSVIKVLSHIENAFNRIWQIDKSRTFGRKFADYLSIMLIGPVLVIMSSSVTVYITTQLTQITQKTALLGMLSTLIFSVLKLLPYGLIWLLFTIMYMLMPNTRVRFLPGLVAGVFAGTAYQIAQWGYISFQIGVARYNAIYGSFAALPLFLIWLQASWLIVLFGAEISHAAQDHGQSRMVSGDTGISPHFNRLLALLVARFIVKRFASAASPPTAPEISRELALPGGLTARLLTDLVDSGTFSRTCSDGSDTPAYQPAADPGLLTVHHVLKCLSHKGSADIPIIRSAALKDLEDTLKAFDETAGSSAANRLLKEI